MATVDLVESGLGLVHTATDITPAWVQGVLRSSGHLEPDVSVTGVATERIGEGVGILSVIQRITPTYSGPTGAPATLVVKYPTDDAGQRFTADALALYVREVIFYRDHAASAPFGTPTCYAAGVATDSTDFNVVIEDIGSMRMLNQLDGVSFDDSLVILDHLADFHAQWWLSPRLDGVLDHFQPLLNDTYNVVLPMLWSGGWPVVMERCPEVVPANCARLGDMWAEKAPWMLAELMEPRTLCHGDYRADNIFFDGGRPVVLDYQIVGVGSGVFDVAYYVSQSITPEVRHGRDRELLDRYLDRLETRGVAVDRALAWRQYQIAVCFCAIYTVNSFPQYDNMNDRGQQLLRDMLYRSLRAASDIDALAALD